MLDPDRLSRWGCRRHFLRTDRSRVVMLFLARLHSISKMQQGRPKNPMATLWFRPGSPDSNCPRVSKHHSPCSNPTASTGLDRGQTLTCKTPVICRPSATRKTTRFSVRDAKYNAAGAMHRVAWALQDSKAIGQICEKPLENLWFCSGEDRNRTFGCFPYVFEEFERYSDKIPRDRNSVQLTIKQRLSERWR